VYQQDYILRIIEQLGVLLKRMLAALTEQQPQQAIDTSTEALGLVLDMDPRLAESLSAPSLVSLLGAGGRLDVRRSLALGEVFAIRAQAFVGLEQADAAEIARGKALVMLWAVLDHANDAEARARATELLEALGDEG